MLVPETADGFRATIGALPSLGEGEGVSFHTFPLAEDRCVRQLLKILGKCRPLAENKEEIEALHINAQAVMQVRSKRRDQDPEKDRPLTPPFIVSVARGPHLAKGRFLTDLCGLRVNLETYTAPKGRFNANAAGPLDTRSVTVALRPGVWLAETRTRRGPLSNAAAAGVTTLPAVVVAVSGKSLWRLLQNVRKGSTVKRMAFPRACQHP
jgi:hypothetical protein